MDRSIFKGDHNCPVCKKSYVRRHNLVAHMQIKHPRQSSSKPSRSERKEKREKPSKERDDADENGDTNSGSSSNGDDESPLDGATSPPRGDSPTSEDMSVDENDNAWRVIMKSVLREWKKNLISYDMPNDWSQIARGGNNYDNFNDDLFDRIWGILISHEELVHSPMFNQLIVLVNLVDGNYNGLGDITKAKFRIAYDLVKPLDQLIDINQDIMERYETDSSEGEEDEEGDNE